MLRIGLITTVPASVLFLLTTPSTMNLQGLVWACLAATALAHGGHEAVPQGESISQDPIVCGRILGKQLAL